MGSESNMTGPDVAEFPMESSVAGPGPGSPAAPFALDIRDLSKSFAGNPALTRLNLTIEPGEIHVLVGQNGSGKSTLIKVLSGYHIPDPGGSVHIAGRALQFGSPERSYRLGCRFVHQDLGLITTTSVLDNLALGAGYPTRLGTIRQRAALADARTTLGTVGLAVSPRQKVGELGAAQRTELAVARALRHDAAHPPKVLVLDEPTATLPVNEVALLLDTVRTVASSGMAILYVTHHLDEVFRIAHRVTVLRDGRLAGTSGIREVDRKTLVQQLVGRQVEEVTRGSVAIGARSQPALKVEKLTAGPLRQVSFSVSPGEIVGLAGLTGSGREAVLGAVFGAAPRDSGRVLVAGKEVRPGRPDLAIGAGIAFLPSDRKAHGGVMPLSARENLTLPHLRPFWRRLRLHRKAELDETRTWFARLTVRPEGALQSPLATFSGGNQQKILFGKWLRQRLPVFLLDEPTQGVDVGAKAELHRHLLAATEHGTAVVVSSTDIDELVTLCDRVLVFRHGQVLDEFTGDHINPSAITHSIMSACVNEGGESQ